MREYLESEVLQRLIGAAFADGIPVAAICHGVVLAARSVIRQLAAQCCMAARPRP
jgi:putative intracellular protease/amidase